MKLIDLLLVAALALFAVGAFSVAFPLGCATLGAGLVAAWFLLGDA